MYLKLLTLFDRTMMALTTLGRPEFSQSALVIFIGFVTPRLMLYFRWTTEPGIGSCTQNSMLTVSLVKPLVSRGNSGTSQRFRLPCGHTRIPWGYLDSNQSLPLFSQNFIDILQVRLSLANPYLCLVEERRVGGDNHY